MKKKKTAIEQLTVLIISCFLKLSLLLASLFGHILSFPFLSLFPVLIFSAISFKFNFPHVLNLTIFFVFCILLLFLHTSKYNVQLTNMSQSRLTFSHSSCHFFFYGLSVTSQIVNFCLIFLPS